MQEHNVVLNGIRLSHSEGETLRMALEMTIIDLENFSTERALEGIRVSEHLANIANLLRIISR